MLVLRYYLLFFLFAIKLSLSAQFVDKANRLGIDHLHGNIVLIGGGTTFVDVNNDNLVDLYLTGGDATPDKLYLNLGNNRFHDISLESGILFHTRYYTTFGVVNGDINNDGCEDLFVTTHSANERNILLLGDCNGRFSDISEKSGINEKSTSTSASFLDVNQDGLLDIYVTNYTKELEFLYDDDGVLIGYDHICYPNFLYLNIGNNSFNEVAAEFGLDDVGCGFTASTSDLDLDGDPDIYVINDFGEWVVPNQMYRNENGVTFSNVSTEYGLDIGLYGMGVAASDFDEDGDVDFYVTNIGSNALLINDGSNYYTDKSTEYGIENTYSLKGTRSTSWGTFFADLDNNGYQDLYVANGYIPSAPFLNNTLEDDNKLFYQQDGIFEDVSQPMKIGSTLINRGAIYGDIDNDGFLDVVTVSVAKTDLGKGIDGSLVSINQKSTGNWLQVDVEGSVSNRNAFGTKIHIYTASGYQSREKVSGGSHASQNSEILHFGLGMDQVIDSVRLIWPSGLQTSITNIAINQRILVVENIDGYSVFNCEESDNYRCFYHKTLGCMDVNSSNYDIFATEDNGGCDNEGIITSLSLSESSIRVYPNPFSDFLIVDGRVDYLAIYDLNGRLIEHFEVDTDADIKLDIPRLGKGIYLLNGSLKGTNVLQKLIFKD